MTRPGGPMTANAERAFELSDEVEGADLHVIDTAPPADEAVSPRNKLNDLSAREWMSESVSVWTQRGLGAGHADAQIERQHPAPFSFTDVARLVRMFTKRGMT